ncbi:MAG: MFS transporter [Betaproteobacteria bacterium]|nr:MFS transporter [Betaproteobacteria bacterium]
MHASSPSLPISRTAMVLMCVAVVTMTSIAISSFPLFLPPIEREFGWSRATATLPYMVSMIGWAVGAVLFGKRADDFGARGVILPGIALMAVGFLGMGLSQNLWHLMLSYGVLVGLAMGACGLTIVSLLVSKHFEAEGRGFAVSMIQTAPSFSALLFAPVLYFLIQAFEWRTAALAAGGMLGLVALPLAWIGARDPQAGSGHGNRRAGWGDCLPYLRNRSMLLLFAARLSCGVAFFQIAHLVALTMSKGFSLASGATAVSVFGATAVAAALLFGWLSDRYGRASMLSLSYLVRGIGTLFLALGFTNELYFYAAVAVAIGPTFGTVAVQNVMFYEIVGPRLAGVVLGLSFIVHQIGAATGPMIASIAFDRTGSYDGFMLVMAVILMVSGLLVYKSADTDTDLRERLLAGRPSAS